MYLNLGYGASNLHYAHVHHRCLSEHALQRRNHTAANANPIGTRPIQTTPPAPARSLLAVTM